MLKLVIRSLVYGSAGLIVTPVVVMFAVLAAAHIFDPRCGTPGDSGGCEMGAAAIAIFSALPGFALGVAVALLQGYRSRSR